MASKWKMKNTVQALKIRSRISVDQWCSPRERLRKQMTKASIMDCALNCNVKHGLGQQKSERGSWLTKEDIRNLIWSQERKKRVESYSSLSPYVPHMTALPRTHTQILFKVHGLTPCPWTLEELSWHLNYGEAYMNKALPLQSFPSMEF